MLNSSSSINQDGQPINPAFNWKRNQNKAAASLIGILSGITADSELNEIEIFFLQNWLENQDDRTGDLLDIFEDIKIILENNKITQEEKEDLFDSLNCCIDFGPKISETDAYINQFLGFLKGITADDNISEIEFKKLCQELSKHSDLKNKWPFDVIKKAINEILKDNFVSLSELKELRDLIQQITGTNFTKYGDAIGGATAMYDNPVPTFTDKNVCLTGKFISGTRSCIKKQIESLGAIPQENVTGETDILVIGTLSSRDWIYTSTGRKIEKAIELIKSGHDLIITNEQIALLKSSF